jgi:hypothetical protein
LPARHAPVEFNRHFSAVVCSYRTAALYQPVFPSCPTPFSISNFRLPISDFGPDHYARDQPDHADSFPDFLYS